MSAKIIKLILSILKSRPFPLTISTYNIDIYMIHKYTYAIHITIYLNEQQNIDCTSA